MIQLSVIIINFNTPEVTFACLNSIKLHAEGSLVNYEVIIVDNAPQREYRHLFESCFPQIVYIKSKLNIGFGKANNLGMEAAKGKYFLLLNSDTLLIDNCLQQCYDYMELEKSKNIGLLGCKLLNEDLSYQHSFYPYPKTTIWNYFISNNPVFYKLFKVHKKFQATNVAQKVGDVSGAFMFLRKSVFEEVKGFDPDFFLYYEETEWCRNRIARRFDIFYYPQTQIIHLGGKSAPREPMLIQSSISEYLFWYKCGYAIYILFVFFSTINAFTYLILLAFTKTDNRQTIICFLKRFFKAIPYWLHYIPMHKNKFNSRIEPLVYKGAKSIFFN